MKRNQAPQSTPRIKLTEGGSISLDAQDDLTLGDLERLIDYATARGFSKDATVHVFTSPSLLSRNVNVFVSENRGARQW
jgi:hypothetical protein